MMQVSERKPCAAEQRRRLEKMANVPLKCSECSAMSPAGVESLLVRRMRERIELARSDSNSEYFYALMYGCEFICKIAASLLVAAIPNDQDRSRYRFEYMLVRADGVGEWAEAMQKLLIGPTSTLMDDVMREPQKELTQKITKGDWRYETCELLYSVLCEVLGITEPMPVKVQLLRWFIDFAQLRNKTRGHGAIGISKIDKICIPLARSFDLMASNLSVLKFPIAYLRRNLSGKYRVSLIGGVDTPFLPLKSSTEYSYEDGVYAYFGKLMACSLLSSDADLSDFYLPNGGFGDKFFDCLSYQTGNTLRSPSFRYLKPADKLPGSITEGMSELDVVGNVFSNIPAAPVDYIVRPMLEDALLKQLILTKAHPIVTMDGRGGIGKTSTALHVVHKLVNDPSCPYNLVLWFSARDVDLMPEGVKEVRPGGITIDDFAKAFVEWTFSISATNNRDITCKDRLAEALSSGINGCTSILFVFDNFETVVSPEETYRWIDSFLRLPNKVLITTRVRGKFRADFPLNVKGMEDEESRNLIVRSAQRLGIVNQLTSDLVDSIVDESGGHPYVIKIMVGEIAKHPNVRSVSRVIAARDDVLDALFERTYRSLTPAAQRIFLMLSGWRSVVAELAVEAIMIRPESEIRDVQKAIDELVDYSFVERIENVMGETFLSVPLVAQVFGKKKVVISPHRGGIKADLELLMKFGAVGKGGLDVSSGFRLRTLFTNIDRCLAANTNTIEDFRYVIEYVARIHPQAWKYLADVYKGSDERMIEYLEKYLESDGVDDINAWRCLYDLYRKMNRPCDMLNVLSKIATSTSAGVYEISDAIGRANALIAQNKELIDREDRRQILTELAHSMQGHLYESSATDLSKLAWLNLNLHNYDMAARLVDLGLQKEPSNHYCLNLRSKLEMGNT